MQFRHDLMANNTSKTAKITSLLKISLKSENCCGIMMTQEWFSIWRPSKSVHSYRRFPIWWPSAILNWNFAILGQPRSELCGLNTVSKFVVDPNFAVGDIAILWFYSVVATWRMCGGKVLRRWLWHCLVKLCTKNYANLSIFVTVTAKNLVAPFLCGHVVYMHMHSPWFVTAWVPLVLRDYCYVLRSLSVKTGRRGFQTPVTVVRWMRRC